MAGGEAVTALRYYRGVKAIRVTFDEALLARFDAHPEVRQRGRSAVLQEAAAAFLAQQATDDAIDRRYDEGYRRFPAHADPDLTGWTSEGVWAID